MKKKIILSIAFIISLLPMFLNQYGELKGVQEITGLINLLNPIGMVSVILFAVGVWFPFKEQVVGKSLGALGTIGIVVSDKADKTITVKVETYKKHPLYGKRVKYSKKYAAHDENNMAHVGDKVRLAQTRPLSKTKRYELVEVIEKAVIL